MLGIQGKNKLVALDSIDIPVFIMMSLLLNTLPYLVVL